VLLRAPEGWPVPFVAGLAMFVLALLDLAGSLVAKEAADRRSPALVGLGVLLFVVLFWVYASTLQVAEMAAVTFGWIVILQVGVVLLDRFHYGANMPAGKWMAVGVLLAAQGYLLLGPSGEAEKAPPPQARHAAHSGVAAIPQPRSGDWYVELDEVPPSGRSGLRAAAVAIDVPEREPVLAPR
jgi:hypothetical protein